MKKKILGYVLEGEGTFSVTPQDIKEMTHMNVAFGRLKNDGSIVTEHLTIPSRIAEYKSYNPDLKILLSIVPAQPEAFSVGSSTKEGRERIADSCAKVITELGFDGVDLDWEYPCVPSNGIVASPDDKVNFTLLCQAIRAALNAIDDGKEHLFTIAAGADVYYTACTEMDKVQEYLDYVCIMTYDLKCGFHALAGHHSNLYASTGDYFRNSCDQALRLFHQAGVPQEKLLLGAAFYSRQWDNIADINHGLLQIGKTGGGYGPDYTKLLAEYINKNGFVRYWDDEAKAPYLFNGSTFISYDDEESIACKCEYVKQENCGGIFYWQHNNDLSKALLHTMYVNLNQSV